MVNFNWLLVTVSLGFIGGAVAGAIKHLRDLHAQAQALRRIAAEDKSADAQTMDFESLGTYLFDTLGAMSIRDYARDHDARRFVARAVDRVEDFLEEGKQRAGETLGRDHLEVADRAIREGDLVAGLTRLRLAIELRLRQQALGAGLPAERTSGGRLLNMLRREDLLDPSTSQDLAYAIKVGNQGVHGEPVDQDQAREALDLTRRALDALDRREAR